VAARASPEFNHDRIDFRKIEGQFGSTLPTLQQPGDHHPQLRELRVLLVVLWEMPGQKERVPQMPTQCLLLLQKPQQGRVGEEYAVFSSGRIGIKRTMAVNFIGVMLCFVKTENKYKRVIINCGKST